MSCACVYKCCIICVPVLLPIELSYLPCQKCASELGCMSLGDNWPRNCCKSGLARPTPENPGVSGSWTPWP